MPSKPLAMKFLQFKNNKQVNKAQVVEMVDDVQEHKCRGRRLRKSDHASRVV